jgi:hypothetical protein
MHLNKNHRVVFDYILFISVNYLAISPSGEKLCLDGCLGNERRDPVVVFVIVIEGGGV